MPDIFDTVAEQSAAPRDIFDTVSESAPLSEFLAAELPKAPPVNPEDESQRLQWMRDEGMAPPSIGAGEELMASPLDDIPRQTNESPAATGMAQAIIAPPITLTGGVVPQREVPKEALDKAAGVTAGILNTGAGVAKFTTSVPGAVGAVALPFAPSLVQRLVALGFSADVAKNAAQQIGRASVSGDPQEWTEGSLGFLMALGLGGAAAKPKPSAAPAIKQAEAVAPLTAEALKQTTRTEGESNASSKQSGEPLPQYEVRPPVGESPPLRQPDEGVAGAQKPVETKAPEGADVQKSVATKPAQLTPSEQSDVQAELAAETETPPQAAAKVVEQPWEMTKEEFSEKYKNIDEELVPVVGGSAQRKAMGQANVPTEKPSETRILDDRWYEMSESERRDRALSALRRIPQIPEKESSIIADVASILPNRFWSGQFSVLVGGEHPSLSSLKGVGRPMAAYGELVRNAKGELVRRGSIEDFYKPTVDVIALFNARTPTDFFHEAGHRWQRKFLSVEEQGEARRIYEQSSQYKKWREAESEAQKYRYSYEEWFANRFHDYLLKRSRGEVREFPTRLRQVFENFRLALASIWKRVRSQSNKPMSDFFDRSFGVEKEALGSTPRVGSLEWFSAASEGFLAERHRFHVERALREGKAIPPEVLADYPDLIRGKQSSEQATHPQGDVTEKLSISSVIDELRRYLKSNPAVGRLDADAKREWLREFGIVSHDTGRKLRYTYQLSDGRVVSAESALKFTNPKAYEALKQRHSNLATAAARADIFKAMPEYVQRRIIDDIPIDEIIRQAGFKADPYGAIDRFLTKEGHLLGGKALYRTGFNKEIYGNAMDLWAAGESPFKTGPDAARAWRMTNKTDDALSVLEMDGKFIATIKGSKKDSLLRKYGWSDYRGKELTGMGGALAEGEPAKPQLAQLTDAIKGMESTESVGGSISDAFELGRKMQSVKDGVTDAVTGLKAAGDWALERLKGKPVVTEFKAALGERNLALSESVANARRFTKSASKSVPNRTVQEAISDYIDAGGDMEFLKRAAAETKERYKAGYEAAQNLTPEQKTFAQNVKNYFDSRLQDAIDNGILEDGIEDYIHRYYEKESPWKRGVLAELRSGIFTGKPALAKKRVYEYDLDAEKAGLRPEKSFIKRIAAYDLSLNKAIADRALVKAMMEMKMPDGKPMLEIGGAGKTITAEEAGKGTATLIRPRGTFKDRAMTEDGMPYKPYDYPALRKWKWVAKDAEGNPIYMQGDVLVHPEAMKQVKALFERSAVRQNPIGRAALGVSSTIKQTMLDLSGFHFTQITVHGWEHRTFKPVREIDFNNPDVRGLVKGGMMVGDTRGYELFAEGSGSASLTRHIPYAGKYLQMWQEFLFSDYIPRLKTAMALHALERNRSRFGKKLSEDEIYALTANQANAAFGELNWEMMGVSKTTQDVMRLALLAPDFLIARGKFAGQAATFYGREQLQALALGGVVLYLTARIVNKLLNDEYHFETKNAFSIIHNGKAYSLRTVQGDILHLATDPMKFAFNRINPVFGRTSVEALTGRDYFGRKRDYVEQLQDLAKTIVPISLRGVLNPREQNLVESFLNAFGITERRSTAMDRITQLAEDWKKSNKIRTEPGEFIYNASKDPFRPIRQAAIFSKPETVASEIDKAVKRGEVNEQQIRNHFDRYAKRPFTGKQSNDVKFRASLSADDQKIFDDAKAERRRLLDNFRRGYSIYNSARPAHPAASPTESKEPESSD